MTKREEKWALTREIVGEGRLSIVMPVYNLSHTILDNLKDTADLFLKHNVRVELIPVDDGSSDNTAEKLQTFSYDGGDIVVIKPVILKKNGGKGAALRAGFNASIGEYILLLDGDLDIHPKQTPWFFDQLKLKNADIVVGSKRHRFSVVQYPWHRRMVSWIYFSLVRLTIGLPITDTQTGMKLFRRKVLGDALDRMLVKTYAFDLELLAIAHQRGARIADAPVVIRFGQKFGCLKVNTVRTMAIDSLAIFYRLRLLRYYAKVEVPKPLAYNPKISIVIACPNTSWMLKQCLNAIKVQTYDNYEVIVLPDEKFELSEEESICGKVRVLPTDKVRPAEKRNLGIREATGEIVAFIDDDAYPDAHWLEYAVKYFSEDSIGAVGGPGITPADDSYLCRIGGRVYDNILVSGNYRYRYKAGSVRRDVDDYPSCNLFVRTSILRKINGYRTDFWPGEDTLLCKDIIDTNARIVYDPWVIVSHHRRALMGAHLRQLGRYAFHRGYFVKRFPSNSLKLSYFIPSAFVAYLIMCFALGILLFAFPSKILFVISSLVLVPLYLYFILVLLTTFAFNPLTWFITAFGVFATHIVYGIRFIQGLCAKKAPCEFIGKDHL